MTHDPAVWPLAPGNASEEYEQIFAAQREAWKVPLSQDQLDLLAGLRLRPAADQAIS